MKCVKTTTILSAIEPTTTVPTHSGVGTRNLLASLKALLFVTATSLFVGLQAEGSGQGNADQIIDHYNQPDFPSHNNAHMSGAATVPDALMTRSASRLKEALDRLSPDKRVYALLKFSDVLRSIIQVSDTMSDILKVLREMLPPEGLYQVFSARVLRRDTLIQSLAECGYLDEVKKILNCINGIKNRERAEDLIINSRNRYGESLWDISTRNSNLRALLEQYTNEAAVASSTVQNALQARSASMLWLALDKISADERVDELLKHSALFYKIIQPDKKRLEAQTKKMQDILAVFREQLDPESLCYLFCENIMDGDTLINMLAKFGHVGEVKKILECINNIEDRENAEAQFDDLILRSYDSYDKNLWDMSAENRDLRVLLEQYTDGSVIRMSCSVANGCTEKLAIVPAALMTRSASRLKEALDRLNPAERVDELLTYIHCFCTIIRPLNERGEEMSGILEVLRKMLDPERLCFVLSAHRFDIGPLIHMLAEYGYVVEVAKILKHIKGIENRARAEDLLEALIINIRNRYGESLWDISAENRDLRALLEQYTNEAAVAQTCLLDAVKAGGEGAVEAIHKALEGKTPQERYEFILAQQDDRKRNAVAICFQNRLYAAARELLEGLSNEHAYNLLATQDASDALALHPLILAGNSENAGAELLKELLARLSEDQKRNLAYLGGERGMTALMWARTPEMIDIILSMVPPDEWDAYMRVQACFGQTALLFASACSFEDYSPDTIRALLERSKDVKPLLSQRTNDAKRTP